MFLGVVSIWQVSKTIDLDEITTKKKKRTEEQRRLGKRNYCERIKSGACDDTREAWRRKCFNRE